MNLPNSVMMTLWRRDSRQRSRSTSQASTHHQESARSRNQAKDMHPILLNNAGPNALHSQQLRFIPRCGRSDTYQSAIAKNPECRNPPALGLT